MRSSFLPFPPGGLRPLALAVLLPFFFPLAGSIVLAARPSPGLRVEEERLVMTPQGPGGSVIQVVDIVDVFNASGSPVDKVILPLVPGYTALKVELPPGARVEEGEDSFAHPSPLPPGERRRYAFSYAIPGLGPGKPAMEVARPVLYPTRAFSLLLPKGVFIASSRALRLSGEVTVGETVFRRYELATPGEPRPDFFFLLRSGAGEVSPYFWLFAAFIALPVAGLLAVFVRGWAVRRSRGAGEGRGETRRR